MSHHPVSRLLRRRLSDEALLITDPDVMAAYSTDRAPYDYVGTPAAVVSSPNVNDVRTVLEVAADCLVPVVPRGAGSGLTGGANAIDDCIVLSTQRLRAEPEVRTTDHQIRVAAGILNAEVKQSAAAHGLLYPPDPASSAFCTIGGNIATNAGGLCCVRYGVTRDWVKEVDLALPGGELVSLGHTTRKGVAGYDLTSLIVGSEGTLGVVTAATLELTRAVTRHATMVAYFDDLVAAGQAVLACLDRPAPPTLLEIMDQATLRAVESWQPMDLNVHAEALLLIQVPADDAMASEIAAIESACTAAGAIDTFASEDPQDAEALLHARRVAFEALEHLGRPLLEDVAVNVSAIPALLARIREIAESHEVTVGTFGHAGDGNLHPIVIMEDASPAARIRAEEAFEEIMTAALDLGGTISGEHGIGLRKLHFLDREIPPLAIDLMSRIKSSFDPLSIMNPGKAIPVVRGMATLLDAGKEPLGA